MGAKRRLLGWVSRALARRGYAVLPAWEHAALRDRAAKVGLLGEGLDGLLRALLPRLRCDVVLDVGANRGQTRDRLRAGVGYAGRIVSYEPIPELAAALAERSRGDPRWTVKSTALGRETGVRTLRVAASDEFSSFLGPAPGRPARFEATGRAEREIQVPVTTLRAELAALRAAHGAARTFVKLDTQGTDLEVFASAGDEAGRIVGVMTEASLVPLYEGTPDGLDTIRTFRDAGFALAGVFPVASDVATGRLVEVDCVFVRPEEVSPPAGASSTA
jgi:FkbM family methyltransferase